MREIGLTLHSSSIWPESVILLRLKQTCKSTKYHFLICNDWQKMKDTSLQHKMSITVLRNSGWRTRKRRGLTKACTKATWIATWWRLLLKKLATITCFLEILRKPKINMHRSHVNRHLMKGIKNWNSKKNPRRKIDIYEGMHEVHEDRHLTQVIKGKPPKAIFLNGKAPNK